MPSKPLKKKMKEPSRLEKKYSKIVSRFKELDAEGLKYYKILDKLADEFFHEPSYIAKIIQKNA